MNSIWIDIGLSLLSGCLIAVGAVQFYRFYFMRETGEDVSFITLFFGDISRGRSLESMLKTQFFSGIACVLAGVAAIIVLFVVF